MMPCRAGWRRRRGSALSMCSISTKSSRTTRTTTRAYARICWLAWSNGTMVPRRNLISRKKEVYPISDYLATYLGRYGRLHDRGVRNEDLLHHNNSIPLYDESGGDTLWSRVFYTQAEQGEVPRQPTLTYALLKASGD